MATMVKEKRREKKKTKDKHAPRNNVESVIPSSETLFMEESMSSKLHGESYSAQKISTEFHSGAVEITPSLNEVHTEILSNEMNIVVVDDLKHSLVIGISDKNDAADMKLNSTSESTASNVDKSIFDCKLDIKLCTDIKVEYKDLTSQLDRLAVPNQFSKTLTNERINEMTGYDAYLSTENQIDNESHKTEKATFSIRENVSSSIADKNTQEKVTTRNNLITSDVHLQPSVNQSALNIEDTSITDNMICTTDQQLYINTQNQCETQLPDMPDIQEAVLPSAPIFEEQTPQYVQHREVIVHKVKFKVTCMQLEEVIKLFGGKEIAQVKEMSEREEAIVEAGPLTNQEHPLVDLLLTFRSSLIAVERERTLLACGFAEEEKSRSCLWKIEKRSVNVSEPCLCGANVSFRASYEHAELLRDRLPVARLRLEGLLRNVQESYCHHQHAALLAHCQIEELISETIQGSKPEIREALSLILQGLRLSDSAPAALARALQRWASALCAALVDARDIRNLLFLIHHLFKQSRSVHWAARYIVVNVDSVSPARVIALLDVLLARPKPTLDTALECTEETEEAWEEVDKHGGGGAVSEGTLRERDLLALLDAFPLRQLVARLVLFTHSDVKHARAHEWAGAVGGRGVVRACCGVRALLATLQRAAHAHAYAHYERLQRGLRTLAARALRALACLHLCSKDLYDKELEAKVGVELEAAFAAGLKLFGTHEVHELTATLLSEDTSRDYCITNILALHDKSPKPIESLCVEMPVLPCEIRVRIVTQAGIDREEDHELARIILEFLVQTGIKRKTVPCAGACVETARECLSRLLAAHSYLYPTALYTFADLNQLEPLDELAVKTLALHSWRPSGDEMRAVLDDWSQRCTPLLQHLLLQLNYTPYTGLSLETQLTIGAWLTAWSRSSSTPSEWLWQVLRRMRLHRTCWNMPIDAPAPETEPTDVFSIAYALLSSSWGHCIPLICSEGVSALCTLAAARPRDATHCLAPLMVVMAHSPESVSLTPKFTELFTILLNSGPSLMQRAMGRGNVSGPDLLLKLVLDQLENEQCAGVHRSSMLSVWLHALWRCTLPTSAYTILDAAALACREWPQLDSHANYLVQEENAKEYITHAIRNASIAPLLCECLLRAVHAQCTRTHVYPQLLRALHIQRVKGDRIHVDNALQQVGASMSGEDLVVHRAAAAGAAAPHHHPANLTLWRLFLHLYLQRPPDGSQDSAPPIGPLFFSGIRKSRTLSHIKKRLQEVAAYHYNETEALKTEQIVTVEETSSKKIDRSKPVDDNLLPALSITDLIGESSGSSDSESDLTDEEREGYTNKEGNRRLEDTMEITERTKLDLLRYHAGAEKMIREYLRWLEEGEKARSGPHHADIARYIPEQALEAGWQNALSRSRPPPCPDQESPLTPTVRPVPVTSQLPLRTPFEIAVESIMKIRDRSRKRFRKPAITSPIEDVDFKDSRTLLALVDKHLKDIERLAHEWHTEVCRVSSLDGMLWELVCALRVRKSLPPVKKQCANKCKPVTIVIPAHEWCISSGAERGIKENRSSARAATRRLARPRPHAARTAAALHTIARRIRGSEVAGRVLDRAWRCAAACPPCPAVHCALLALTADLAQRWICQDGRLCAELLSRWSRNSSTPVQQAQCGALVVSPQGERAGEGGPGGPLVYTALLTSPLPDHILFSCLSKFEMTRWSQTLDSTQRRDLLEALLTAAQRWGPAPDPQHNNMVLELLGVHTRALLNAPELCAHATRCTRVSVAGKLPAQHWTYVASAADDCAVAVPFDQLGHLLRELGVMWWEARTGIKGLRTNVKYAAYAPYIARLLRALQRAFVVAGVKLSYAPERIALYAWSALQESWGAWISPHPAAPPLLPTTTDEEAYTPMVKHFVDTILQIMVDCPGTEVPLLQKVFEWATQTYLNASGGSQEGRVQAAALLAALDALPWHRHQWCYGDCLRAALQIGSVDDRELTTWSCRVWSHTTAETWASGGACADEQVVPRLTSLLYLFTGTTLPHTEETLEEATRLAWWRLPELALDEAMDRFFVIHHNPARPYHDLPQFRVFLHASGLRVRRGAAPPPGRASVQAARARGTSRWVRAACEPALHAHVPAHCTALLHVLTQLAAHLGSAEGEIEELLSRAVVIMCIEPAATAALPVWERWVSSSAARLAGACVSAAAALTAFEYFAPLADTAVKAHLNHNESTGWSEVVSRWASCPWHDPYPLAVRCRLHAAYACALTHVHDHNAVRTTLHALIAADINFMANEAIVAVWICYLCRIGRECGGRGGEGGECAAAAMALAARWAEPPRSSIIRLVTMQQDERKPTMQHRLLCRLAQCILSPSEGAARAFEAGCGALPAEVTAWGRAPRPRHLPRLALRLYPQYERYFTPELEMAPEDTG